MESIHACQEEGEIITSPSMERKSQYNIAINSRMRTVYATVSPKITVEPLLFSDSELDAQAFLSLMAIGTSEAAPLYMQTLLVCF